MKNEVAPVRRHALPGPNESGYIMTNTRHPRGSQARLARRGPAVEGFSDSGVGLIIEYADTVDMPDGQPLPPYIDDNVVWHVVRRADAWTRWRRIRLSSEISEHAIVAVRSRSPSTYGGNHVTQSNDTKVHAKNNAKTTEKINGHAKI
jgi:hypothetical protein